MKFDHSFSVPAGAEVTWRALNDLELVAGCFPGASLDEASEDRFSGSARVRLGPMQLTYRGSGRFVQRDQDRRVADLDLQGRETRGAGTAKAAVRLEVVPTSASETRVAVLTELNITGRPAQFGRGVMDEVASQLLGRFAANLASAVESSDKRGDAPVAVDAPPLNLLSAVGSRRVVAAAGVLALGLAALVVLVWARPW